MRMTAPATGGAAIIVAIALVWYLGPDAEPPLVLDTRPRIDAPQPVLDAPAAPAASRGESAPTDVPLDEVRASSTPPPERAPLPGETPATPMTQLIADRQNNVIMRRGDDGNGIPPGLTEGELEFAAEPIDAAWAPGAEADLLAKFAQMPGLKLIDLRVECRSTMCRLQLTQPREAPPERGSPPSRQQFNLLHASTIDPFEPRWMMVIGDGTGPTRSVAYLWREGFARRDCYKDGQQVPCAPAATRSGN